SPPAHIRQRVFRRGGAAAPETRCRQESTMKAALWIRKTLLLALSTTTVVAAAVSISGAPERLAGSGQRQRLDPQTRDQDRRRRFTPIGGEVADESGR